MSGPNPPESDSPTPDEPTREAALDLHLGAVCHGLVDVDVLAHEGHGVQRLKIDLVPKVIIEIDGRQ